MATSIIKTSNDWINSKWIKKETKNTLKFIGEGAFGVMPNSSELAKLISGLTQFESEKRLDVFQALELFESFKAISKQTKEMSNQYVHDTKPIVPRNKNVIFIIHNT